MKKLRLFLAFLAPVLCFAASPLDKAVELYKQTDYAAVLRLLSGQEHKDAATHALMGKAYYMNGDFKKATESLERAVALEPRNAEHYLWLGRAFGRRAETSSFVTAPGYASKTRQNFEKAVELNPRNTEALGDLFQYYMDAPGFLGGGMDKADALADRYKQIDPVEYHYAKARVAEKRKEFGTAEQQLRRAVDIAPKQVGRVLDLAKFLSNRGRYDESEEVFQRAEKIAPDSPQVLFERASAYIKSGRNLHIAKALLKRYIQSPLTPEDPPRREAEALLKQVSSS